MKHKGHVDGLSYVFLGLTQWCVLFHYHTSDTSAFSSQHLNNSTVYPKNYAHGFVVLCFVVVMQSFIMNSHEVFIHIHQGCFAGTEAIVRLPQCQWSKPDGYGKISQCITTTKHSKAKTVCIFLGIYCMYSYSISACHPGTLYTKDILWNSQVDEDYHWCTFEKTGLITVKYFIYQESTQLQWYVGNSVVMNWYQRKKIFFFNSVDMSSVKQVEANMAGIVGHLAMTVTAILHYSNISNRRRTKSPNWNVSRLVLQLSLPNPMKPCVKSRMKI